MLLCCVSIPRHTYRTSWRYNLSLCSGCHVVLTLSGAGLLSQVMVFRASTACNIVEAEVAVPCSAAPITCNKCGDSIQVVAVQLRSQLNGNTCFAIQVQPSRALLASLKVVSSITVNVVMSASFRTTGGWS